MYLVKGFDLEIKNSQNLIITNNSVNMQNTKECNQTQPNFKGKKINALFETAGKAMSKIEKGGFLALFLIQDFLGMTMPRSYAGFLRDKEVTGEYNIQEGTEVLGREGLTGPVMMAVAPTSLYFAGKWGRSTSINSEFIKRFGNNLKEIVSGNNYNQSLIKDSAKFKEDFYTKNIIKILNETLGEANVSEESVKYILEQVKNCENIPEGATLEKFRGKSKYRAKCLNNIAEHINEIRYKTSSDLEMLGKIKFGSEFNEVRPFNTKDTFEAMIKYAQDAENAGKKAGMLDKVLAESLKNKALGKRAIINVSLVFATLGVLSVLPKIYARSDIAPGAKTRMKQQQNYDSQNKEPSFKGKNNALENIGKIVDKNKNKFISSELEYNKHNLTSTLMAGMSIFGLITPRGFRAYKRAQKDENGKKDFTEIWEIIIRDLTSSLAVVFAVPMLTRAAVTSYENKSGFVLMHKDRNIKGAKKYFDLLNPYSKAHVLSNEELSALYENVNSKEKMINFCKYIDNNGGDLNKILSKSETAQEIFKELSINPKDFAGKDKKQANKEILSLFENIETHVKKLGITSGDEKKKVNEIITKLMKGAGAKGGKNKIAMFAKGMNSLPGLISTVFISPYILGLLIPRLTYKNTRRIHEKQDREKQQLKVAV